MNFKCTLGMHQWAGCKCMVCGKTQDKDHDWLQDWEKCAVCGITRPTIREFYKAIEAGSRSAVTALLKDSPSLVSSEEPNTKNTPLHLAAISSASICDVLLNSGAKINAQNVDGNTPMHLAVRADNQVAIDVLRCRGANLELKNNLGTSPWSAMVNKFGSGPEAAKKIDLMARLLEADKRLIKSASAAANSGQLTPAWWEKFSNDQRNSPANLSIVNSHAYRMGMRDLVERNQLRIELCQMEKEQR